MIADLRIITLMDWLENDLLLQADNFQPASSDASFRRYFRFTSADDSFIVMDAPPDKEKLAPFIHVAGLMASAGVKTPEIYQQNFEDGFLLLEDFGSQSFLQAIGEGAAEVLYPQALASLFRLQTCRDLVAADLPHYDQALLHRELAIFSDWFIGDYLDLTMPEALWDAVQACLVESALAQPVTCVHRDYHSRNLMVLAYNQIGVIDFQDAVIGPITYDVVSLLRDCYVAWPEQQLAVWLQDYYQRLQAEGLVAVDYPQFKRWFDLMGMQRHLKAIGIFSRLHLRDGKSGYLADIPRTLNYVIQVCGEYPELAEFGEFLQATVLPAWQKNT